MNIVVYKSTEEKENNLIEISGRRALHIYSVLKLAPGDNIKLGEFNKSIRSGRVVEASKTKALIEISSEEIKPKRVMPNVELVLAMPRPQTLKKVIELSACLSISSLKLIETRKVEKSYFSSKSLTEKEIEKHIILGLEQGRKVFAPDIQVDRDFLKRKNFKEYLKYEKIVLDASGEHSFYKFNLSKSLVHDKKIVIAIGPEGGWTKQELSLMFENDFSICSLGNTPLRVEYAVCSVLSSLEQLLSFN